MFISYQFHCFDESCFDERTSLRADMSPSQQDAVFSAC